MVISILGLSGKNKDKTETTTAFYDAKLLHKKSGDYHNATHFLLENYSNEKFFFLGTQKAIDFQKELLDFSGTQTEFIEIEDNSLDDIFENVFELIAQAHEDETILLDITHGFRHQPISAIFSATLHRFLHNDSLQIVFAKQIVEYKEYEYILLNQYLDITQLSLLLTGFIRTLNFVEGVQIEGFETVAFANFSKALLSNDFYTLQTSHKNLLATVRRAKEDQRFDHLKDLFGQIEETLSVFDNFGEKALYEQYLIVANLMFSKNYILLSLTYLFEALRFYCKAAFDKKGLINRYAKENLSNYHLNQAIISFITQDLIDEYKPTFYDRRYPHLYAANKELFCTISETYKHLKELRNKLTHINSEEHSPDIKTKLKTQLQQILHIIENDMLQTLDTKTKSTPSKPKERVVKDLRKKR